MRPHRRQPTRLSRPWDSPGKNTGVGCHFLLQYMKVKVKSCPTPSDPVDWSLPGSSIHGTFPARVLEWVATAFSVQLPTQLEPAALDAASAATTDSAPRQPSAVPLGADSLPEEGRPAPCPGGSWSLRQLHPLRRTQPPGGHASEVTCWEPSSLVQRCEAGMR